MIEIAPTDELTRRAPPTEARARSGHAQFLWKQAEEMAANGDLKKAQEAFDEIVCRWPADQGAQHELRVIRDRIAERKKERVQKHEDLIRKCADDMTVTTKVSERPARVAIAASSSQVRTTVSVPGLIGGIAFGVAVGTAIAGLGKVVMPPDSNPAAVAAVTPVVERVVLPPSPIEVVEVTAGQAIANPDSNLAADVRHQVVEIQLASFAEETAVELRFQAIGRTLRGLPFASRSIVLPEGVPVGEDVRIQFRTPRAVVLDEIQVHFQGGPEKRVDRVAIPAAWFEMPTPTEGGAGVSEELAPYLTGISETAVSKS